MGSCIGSNIALEGFYSKPQEGLYSTLAGQLTPGLLEDAWLQYSSADNEKQQLSLKAVQELLIYVIQSYPVLYKKSVRTALTVVRRYHTNKSDFDKIMKPLYQEVKEMVSQMERTLASLADDQQDQLIKDFVRTLDTDDEKRVSFDEFLGKFRNEIGPEIGKYLLGLETNALHHFAERQTAALTAELKSTPDVEDPRQNKMFSNSSSNKNKVKRKSGNDDDDGDGDGEDEDESSRKKEKKSKKDKKTKVKKTSKTKKKEKKEKKEKKKKVDDEDNLQVEEAQDSN